MPMESLKQTGGCSVESDIRGFICEAVMEVNARQQEKTSKADRGIGGVNCRLQTLTDGCWFQNSCVRVQ